MLVILPKWVGFPCWRPLSFPTFGFSFKQNLYTISPPGSQALEVRTLLSALLGLGSASSITSWLSSLFFLSTLCLSSLPLSFFLSLSLPRFLPPSLSPLCLCLSVSVPLSLSLSHSLSLSLLSVSPFSLQVYVCMCVFVCLGGEGLYMFCSEHLRFPWVFLRVLCHHSVLWLHSPDGCLTFDRSCHRCVTVRKMGCDSVIKVPAYHTQCPEFGPWHHKEEGPREPGAYYRKQNKCLHKTSYIPFYGFYKTVTAEK